LAYATCRRRVHAKPPHPTPRPPLSQRPQPSLADPARFELPGDEVIIHKEGDRLIVEPVKKPNTLAELLASWEPLEEEFPDVDDGLLPLDDVKL
jgi:antitoxin VapB